MKCGLLTGFFIMQMKEKIKKIIREMDISELREFKDDLESGNYIKDIINKKIDEIEEPKLLRCNTCNSFIGRNNSRAYSLEFGSMTDKKKAHFCKYECLRYFLTILEGKDG